MEHNKNYELDAQKSHKRLQYIQERAEMRMLLLSNPNYFGNLKDSPFEPVLKIQQDSTYENICSVGFNPKFNRLEAIIHINEPEGYGGGVCSAGIQEYVRFFMSTNNGLNWEDLGVASFTAYDIPEGTMADKRLEYAVSLDIEPKKKYCDDPNLAQIRAILSHDLMPPPNDPNFIPVWGDIHDTHIQIDPKRIATVPDFFLGSKIQIDPKIADLFELNTPIHAKLPKALTLAERNELYRGQQPHRFAFPELKKMMTKSDFGGSQLAQVDFDWSKFKNQFGDTQYEELECIGLDPNLEQLAGVIRVKLPTIYLGDLCSPGSLEYVTFWADLDNSGFYETCLGTTSVNVYDIATIPEEGLEYAVFLPVDVSTWQRPCEAGPVVVRILAILSWNDPPPCGDPDFIPRWGNRLQTLIHIKPGPTAQDGTHPPVVQTVGSMHMDDIDNASGLADGAAQLVGFTADDSPFGGEVVITGHIGNTPDISAGATKLKYLVEVSGDGWTTRQLVTNPFTLKREQLLNSVWSTLPDITQNVDVEGWYEYQEDMVNGAGNATIYPAGNVLARWNTAGLNGLWQLRIRAKDPSDPAPQPEWVSNVVTVMLDNKVPDATISITSGGGACADFIISQKIKGTYSATDLHFGSLKLSVLPALGGSFTSPAPLPADTTMPLVRRYSDGVAPGGESGNWKLDTSGMPRCGYIIRLEVWDRTIRDSGFIGFYDTAVVGLCLREPEA